MLRRGVCNTKNITHERHEEYKHAFFDWSSAVFLCLSWTGFLVLRFCRSAFRRDQRLQSGDCFAPEGAPTESRYFALLSDVARNVS